MSDHVTITLSRPEYDAVLAVLREAGTGRTSDQGGPALSLLDLRDALRTMEAAGRVRRYDA